MNERAVIRKKFSSFDLDGNNLALDFVNTVEYRNTEREIDWLTSYFDALGWAERASILTSAMMDRLWEQAENQDSSFWYEEVLSRREVLHTLFFRIISQVPDSAPAIQEFNALYRSVRRRIDAGADGFSWMFPEIEAEPVGFLQPVVQAAADVLVTGNPERLKRCSDSECGWLYYDTSKNNSRRWCSMKTCGNRAKAGKFYQTHK